MPALTIQLPVKNTYHEDNLLRWEEILRDASLANHPGKVETNRHGQILMMPPASGNHSRLQGEIAFKIRSLLNGHSLPECPVSTVNGVRAADVGWYSEERFQKIKDQSVFEIAPEICVEVVSPSNTKNELEEKKQLYFEAGAEEVWFCDESGMLTFFEKSEMQTSIEKSRICSNFPTRIESC